MTLVRCHQNSQISVVLQHFSRMIARGTPSAMVLCQGSHHPTMSRIFLDCLVNTMETRPQAQCHMAKKQQVNRRTLDTTLQGHPRLIGLTPQHTPHRRFIFLSPWGSTARVLNVDERQTKSEIQSWLEQHEYMSENPIPSHLVV